jgi:hypothetical protein
LEESPKKSYQTRPESDRVSIQVILGSWLLAIMLGLFSVDENHGENGWIIKVLCGGFLFIKVLIFLRSDPTYKITDL